MSRDTIAGGFLTDETNLREQIAILKAQLRDLAMDNDNLRRGIRVGPVLDWAVSQEEVNLLDLAIRPKRLTKEEWRAAVLAVAHAISQEQWVEYAEEFARSLRIDDAPSPVIVTGLDLGVRGDYIPKEKP